MGSSIFLVFLPLMLPLYVISPDLLDTVLALLKQFLETPLGQSLIDGALMGMIEFVKILNQL